jgi:hypothetical protein
VLMADHNLGFVGTESREKHTVEPMVFGTPIAFSGSFKYYFSFSHCLRASEVRSARYKASAFSLR